ncbi:phenylalanine--tRNA ligase alpha subunit isoform X1 [Diachasma alloeum]|uniref:phenylalanine--tRNA ligase alpha subunit isoform X1 n=2 Tax=Diachasma alloeum TaxID=454923 RepID=UPI00073815C5|nr:phenylalanine--tRNA ligase alpha subunit isoform X1 [Diachasma alloeum]XP_015117400.1 phenylalanine--tRNA ligase alpha subunit isoform X1 [Diachasma alloeum]
MASELAEGILQYVDKNGEVNSLDLVNVFEEDHQKIIGAIKSLQTLDNVIDVEQVSQKRWEPTPEGEHVIEHGSHEAAVYKAVPEAGIPQSEIMKSVPYAKVGFSKAIVAGWIKLDKSTGKPTVTRNVSSIEDTTQMQLKSIESLPDNMKAEYKKRKLLQEIVIKSVIVRKGRNFVTKIEKQEADLTADLLVNNSWKEKKFKPYNFDALGAALDVGHLHPLLKVRTEFRKIFLEMGFTEMPTNNFVESSFWNFDALFQPQQHPARDAHDTFFISDPKFTTEFPQEYLQKVKEVHSNGGYGSEGYRYSWKIEEAQKNLLRTHTTAVSARMLYNLMQNGEFKPVRYFSIDRVFRNETLDATHLAEFHQVEGVVADYNLTLGDLIGTLYEFFKKLGIDKLEFKPAYNPYTEPSMEIFCFHEGLGKWIEIGNSGVFRPEMLLPMGLPKNVNVIAWGLSLERPTMIKYKLNNIRDLVGPKVDLQMVYTNPICRLEKVAGNSQMSVRESQEDETTHSFGNNTWRKCEKLEKQNFVIFCDPKHPILWLEALIKFTKNCLKTTLTTHLHSSAQKVPLELENFCSDFKNSQKFADLTVTFIWKSVGVDPVLKFDGNREIFGQVNIARYFNRLIEQINPSLLRYESKGPLYANKIDRALEKIHNALHNSKELHYPETSKSRYIFEELSIVDLILEGRR